MNTINVKPGSLPWPSEQRVLLCASEIADEGIQPTQRKIAKRLGLSIATVTEHCHRLRARGLISFTDGKTDMDFTRAGIINIGLARRVRATA